MKLLLSLTRPFSLCLFSAAYLTLAASGQQPHTESNVDRAEKLITQMTLEEKVSQMQNHSVAIPRLGIPEYDWWNEGLHGTARSGYATLFPQAIGMAATWDAELIHQVGETISTEARAKYNQAIREGNHSIYYGLTIWSPNINIFRDPRWGRGQETYGEDPFLTGTLGVAFIRGLQGDDPKYFRTIGTPKHFAVHSGPESERHRFNVNPSPHDLEDTYLPAFRATITVGHAQSIMCAYNAVDGDPACANKQLLGTILRGAWQFPGFVTSDCGAVDDIATFHKFTPDVEHAAVLAVRAGTDTSCGTEYATLAKAVKDGLLQESELDAPLKRLFLARFELGMFDPPAQVPYATTPLAELDSNAHRALALKTAREAVVLLKNENHTLPLASSLRAVAVIGPNAASLAALEGNYNAIPSHPVTPLDGLRAALPHVLYAQGATYVDGLNVPAPETLFHPASGSAEAGLHADYYANADFSGAPALTRTDSHIDFDWNAASPAPSLPLKHFSVRWTGTLTPPAPGDYRFNVTLEDCYPCSDAGTYSVYVDGKPMAMGKTDAAQVSRSRVNAPFTLHFTDTHPHAFRLEYGHTTPLFGAGITLNWQPPVAALRNEAVAVAQKADAVIAFVGLSPDLEGEEMPVRVPGFAGGDRTSLDLPAPQQEMLEAVAATGKPLIVVLMNGSALAVNWAQQHASALLEAWYPGEAGGEAIADTLVGKSNPAGRLPVTFYASLDQLPPFDDYSMQKRTYRYSRATPLYRFGDGMSYTRFTYSSNKLAESELKAGDPLHVTSTVTNSGSILGEEVVEAYLTPPASDTAPVRELVGFARVRLGSGESRQVMLTIAPRQLSQVDAEGHRAVTPGAYKLFVGGRQPGPEDAGLAFTITGSEPLPR